MIMKKGLNAYWVKFIAMIAMLLDHFAHIAIILPINLNTATSLATAMNVVGRVTMPVMCYFIAEGYHHTSSLKKYFLRLIVFAIISQIPYYLWNVGLQTYFIDFLKYSVFHMNVIYTLTMGLLALTIAKSKTNTVLKLLGMFAAVILTKYSDWGIYGVLWVLVFGIFHGDFKMQAVWFGAISIIRCLVKYTNNTHAFALQLCTLLALPLLYLYNGERGRKSKYGFYIFYPLHLLILAIIRYLVIT